MSSISDEITSWFWTSMCKFIESEPHPISRSKSDKLPCKKQQCKITSCFGFSQILATRHTQWDFRHQCLFEIWIHNLVAATVRTFQLWPTFLFYNSQNYFIAKKKEKSTRLKPVSTPMKHITSKPEQEYQENKKEHRRNQLNSPSVARVSAVLLASCKMWTAFYSLSHFSLLLQEHVSHFLVLICSPYPFE